MNDKAVHRIAPSLGGLKPREFLACRLRDQTIFDVRTKSFSTEKRVLPDLVLFFLLCYQPSNGVQSCLTFETCFVENLSLRC